MMNSHEIFKIRFFALLYEKSRLLRTFFCEITRLYLNLVKTKERERERTEKMGGIVKTKERERERTEKMGGKQSLKHVGKPLIPLPYS